MPLFFIGRKKEKEQAELNEKNVKLAERTRELLEAYDKLRNSVLIDTVRITESLLDRTGLTDIDKTMWGAEYPDEDSGKLKEEPENIRAVKKTVRRLYHQISTMDADLTPMNYEMRMLLEKRGTNFAEYDPREIVLFRKAAELSVKIRELLAIPVLDANGELTKEAGETAENLLSE